MFSALLVHLSNNNKKKKLWIIWRMKLFPDVSCLIFLLWPTYTLQVPLSIQLWAKSAPTTILVAIRSMWNKLKYRCMVFKACETFFRTRFGLNYKKIRKFNLGVLWMANWSRKTNPPYLWLSELVSGLQTSQSVGLQSHPLLWNINCLQWLAWSSASAVASDRSHRRCFMRWDLHRHTSTT